MNKAADSGFVHLAKLSRNLKTQALIVLIGIHYCVIKK